MLVATGPPDNCELYDRTIEYDANFSSWTPITMPIKSCYRYAMINNPPNFVASFEQFLCGMFTKSVRGEYTWVNETLLGLQGVTRRDVVGKTDRVLPWGAYADQLRRHDEEILDRKIPILFVETILRRGNKIDGYCHKSPIYCQQNKLIGIGGIYFQGPAHKSKSPRLSIREKQCLKNLVDGMTAKTSAEQLKISRRTVESYLENMRQKFHCKNQADLITFYYENYR